LELIITCASITLTDNPFCINVLYGVCSNTNNVRILATMYNVGLNDFFFVKVCSSNAESVPAHNRWYQYIMLCTVLFLNPFLDQLVAPCNHGDRSTETAAGL
jgi:hypothetical protein